MLTLGLVGAFFCALAMSLSTFQLYVHVGAYLGMMAAVLVGVIGNRSQLGEIATRTGLGSGALGSMSRLAMTLGQVRQVHHTITSACCWGWGTTARHPSHIELSTCRPCRSVDSIRASLSCTALHSLPLNATRCSKDRSPPRRRFAR